MKPMRQASREVRERVADWTSVLALCEVSGGSLGTQASRMSLSVDLTLHPNPRTCETLE